MHVSLIQLEYSDAQPESVEERTHRVCDLIAAQTHADLVVLPELWSAGAFNLDDWEARKQHIDGHVSRHVRRAAAEAKVWLHAGSIVEWDPVRPGPEGKSLYNTSLLFGPDGLLRASYRKIHRFGFAEGEPRMIEAGTQVVAETIGVARAIAAENEASEMQRESLRLGLATCYDLRFPEMFRELVDLGATAFVVPAAWPDARISAWETLLRARAIENQAFVFGCNTAGCHGGQEMGGRSVILGPLGEVLAQAEPGERETVISAEVHPEQAAQLRASFPVLADRQL